MLKEQVITPRAGRASSRNRSGANAIAQRPVTKHSSGEVAKNNRRPRRATWKWILAYIPLTLKCLLAIGIGVVAFVSYRAAASASFFQVADVEIDGTRRASKEQLRTIVRRAVTQTGVWKADLEAIKQQLEDQPWVRAVVVSRVLPSGLRVRVTEREPRVVVRTSTGRLVWVDEDGVTLNTVSPTDAMPAFFMRGWDESGAQTAHTENRERVAKYLEMAREWKTAGLANRVSELNLDDLRDIRAQLAGDDSQIEVRLGREDSGKRLEQALKVLDEQRQTPRRPFITYIDVTQGTRAVIGSNVKAQAAVARNAASVASVVENNGAPTSSNVAVKAKRSNAEDKRVIRHDARSTGNKSARSKNEERQKRRLTGEDRALGRARARVQTAERPRRVG